MYKSKDRKIDGWRDRHRDRQRDRQTDRQTDSQTDSYNGAGHTTSQLTNASLTSGHAY